MCVRERECVCKRERKRESVCVCVCVCESACMRVCVCVYEITFVIIFIRNYNLNTICFWLHFILRCPCYSVIILSYNDIILLRVTSRCVTCWTRNSEESHSCTLKR